MLRHHECPLRASLPSAGLAVAICGRLLVVCRHQSWFGDVRRIGASVFQESRDVLATSAGHGSFASCVSYWLNTSYGRTNSVQHRWTTAPMIQMFDRPHLLPAHGSNLDF